MLFSERIGKSHPKGIQIDSMDRDLKTSLWNVINIYINTPFLECYGHGSLTLAGHYINLFHSIWYNFLKIPTDHLPHITGYSVVDQLRKHFNSMDYLGVYNFIDFLAREPFLFSTSSYVKEVNVVLKRELSGYRFVEGFLVPIIDENEISAIELAVTSTVSGKLRGVNIHLKEALNKLADRKSPDYRNSIKESISAVEALCQVVSSEEKSQLGKALTRIKNTVPIHPSLVEGYKKIYGYTSDGDGIRHALMEESNLDQEDAMYMLVSCSAFINYLIAKSAKANIALH